MSWSSKTYWSEISNAPKDALLHSVRNLDFTTTKCGKFIKLRWLQEGIRQLHGRSVCYWLYMHCGHKLFFMFSSSYSHNMLLYGAPEHKLMGLMVGEGYILISDFLETSGWLPQETGFWTRWSWTRWTRGLLMEVKSLLNYLNNANPKWNRWHVKYLCRT